VEVLAPEPERLVRHIWQVEQGLDRSCRPHGLYPARGTEGADVDVEQVAPGGSLGRQLVENRAPGGRRRGDAYAKLSLELVQDGTKRPVGHDDQLTFLFCAGDQGGVRFVR